MRRSLRWAAGLVVGVGVFGLVAAGVVAWGARQLTVAEPAPSDVVVFLTGGEPERAAYAHALVERGLAARVLSTTADPQCPRPGGLWSPCVSVARNTVDEALFVARALPTLGARRATIVTSRYHVRRTAAVFLVVFLGSGIDLQVVAPPNSPPARPYTTEPRKLVPSVGAAVIARLVPPLYDWLVR